jgi:hypothetical protein
MNRHRLTPEQERAAAVQAQRIVNGWDRFTADLADSFKAIADEFRKLGEDLQK